MHQWPYGTTKHFLALGSIGGHYGTKRSIILSQLFPSLEGFSYHLIFAEENQWP